MDHVKKGFYAYCYVLIDAGADLTAENQQGQTPLAIAECYGGSCTG